MLGALSRRGFIGTAVATGMLLPQRGRAAAGMGFDDARHLLARTSFGATPAEIRAVEQLDYAAAVDKVLAIKPHAAATAAPDWVSLSPVEVQRRQRDADAERRDAPDGKKAQVVRPVQEQGRELKNWWIEEMLATDQPLVERMTLFWHGHFTSAMAKVRYAPALFRQNALFRRESLGNFATLLRGVARDPAMLIYLDGMRSVARQPNENFARELLELFTLGEGHYGEADIKAAARAFTGWSVDRENGNYIVRAGQHDDGEKTFLGKTGRFGGDDILNILLAHPRTAELVVEKMWREFVSMQPDPQEVKRLANDFRRNGYEIKPLIKALLLSPGFRDPANRGALIKSPVELIVGTVHVLGLPVPEKTGLVRMVQGLGQVPFDPPNVKGWAGGEAWITTYTLLLRQQFLRRMVEATTVAPMEAGMMVAQRPNRRIDRREQLPDESKQMIAPPRPVEGRSLRNAGHEARLGPTLAGVDNATLVRALLPRPPIETIDSSGSAGAVVAAALLDTAYQLK